MRFHLMAAATEAFSVTRIIFLLTLAWTTASAETVPTWRATFANSSLKVQMNSLVQVELTLSNVPNSHGDTQLFQLQSKKPHLARVVRNDVIPVKNIDVHTGIWRDNITILTNFMGETNISVVLYDPLTNTTEQSDVSEQLKLIIIRPQRAIDHAFIGSVILLTSLLYINFGAALDTTILRSIITRPVGPAIGLLTQFIAMPLLSYGLGLLIFPDSPELQLGLFFTGVSPSGGASNTWAVVLGGNVNLSVLMTSLGNLLSFLTIPFWVFTLGRLIFERGNMAVPYERIATMAAGLLIPLLIGLAIQRFAPRLARVLVRLLKPISMCLILFIVIFAIVTNYYLFELFSWQIAVAGLALPWLGYILAWLLSKLMHQNNVDALTIAIETGIQNTGIAIFLLAVGGLPQPQADLTTVVPVSVAIMTPLPLLCLYVYKRCAHPTDGEQVNQNLIRK